MVNIHFNVKIARALVYVFTEDVKYIVQNVMVLDFVSIKKSN